MSQQLFETSGISLGNTISILYGVEPPGSTQETIDALQGSVYFDTSGFTWKKVTSGNTPAAWSQSANGNESSINALRNITGSTVADSLDASLIDTGVWAVTVSSVADPLNRQTVVITGSHNGTSAKYTIYGRMDFGAKIVGITYDVRLNGANFELVVFAPTFCNIDCYRLNSVANNSSITLIGGGTGGGTGDVTSAQLNSEISARTAGDLATQTSINSETTARIAADDALDAKISGKADITGLTTQLATINQAISDEVTLRTSQVGALTTESTDTRSALTAEIAARIAADAALQTAIDAAGGSYTLPVASDTVLGGIKIGTGLSVDVEGVVSSAAAPLVPATDLVLGGVKVGTGLSVDVDGVLSAAALPLTPATDLVLGGVMFPPNTGIGVNPDGSIFLNYGEGLTVDVDGVLKTTTFVAPVAVDTQIFSFDGIVKPTTGVARWYPYADSTITQFYTSIEYPPLSAVVLQLKKNGVAVGTPITIEAGSYKSDVVTLSEVVTPTDYLTVDIVSGSSGAGVYATAVVNVAQTPANSSSLPLPKATNTSLGFIKVGTGLTVSPDGTLNATATGSGSSSINFADNHDFEVTVMGIPLANSLVAMYVSPAAFTLSASGVANALVASTAEATFSLKLNGVQIGTVVFSAGNPIGVVNSVETSIAIGDVLSLYSPIITDATLTDVSVTIGGNGAVAAGIPNATNSSLGLVKAGVGVSIGSDGSLNVLGNASGPINFSAYSVGVPIGNQIIGMQLALQNYTMLGTGFARTLAAPTDASTCVFKVNGVQKGTIDFAPGSLTGVINIPSTAITAGDLLQLFAPVTGDLTLETIAVTLS